MNLNNREILEKFTRKHVQSKSALLAWASEALAAKWTCFDDIKKRYQSADWLPGKRVVFDICGNKYRLIVRVNFARWNEEDKIHQGGDVYIRFIGTHAEYDKIDATKA